MNNDMTTRLSVKVTPTVLDADGNVKRVYEEQSNMLTDNGLDAYGYYGGIEQNMQYFHIGTGTTPTNKVFGYNGVYHVGTDVWTVGSDFFVPEDVGRLIQFSDESTARIVSYTDAKNVVVDVTGSLEGYDCKVWNVDQYALDTPYQTSQFYDRREGSSGNGMSYVTNDDVVDAGYVIQTYTRSIKFLSAGAATITEAGWSKYASNLDGDPYYNSLFGRVVFDTPIVLGATDTISLKVSISRTLPYGSWSADPIFGQPVTLGGEYSYTTSSTAPFKIIESDGTNQGGKVYQMGLFDPGYVNNDMARIYYDDNTYYAITMTFPNSVQGAKSITSNLMEWNDTIAGKTITKIVFYGYSSFYRESFKWTYDTPYVIPANATGATLQITISWDRQLPAFSS
jgi:hypothetical protein